MLAIGDICRMTGISTRTLRYYDKKGLLKPGGYACGGVRLYGDEELARLQQILFYRELGMPLNQIMNILSSPSFDRTQALQQHRALLRLQRDRLEQLLQTVDHTLETWEGGKTMGKEDFKGFDKGEIEAHQAKYAQEAQQRWGDTEAYVESQRRAKNYRPEDWKRIEAEGERLMERLVAAFDAGWAADDKRAMDIAEGFREQISRHFYSCGLEVFRGLGQMYTADERFAAYYNRHREGLAPYYSAIVAAYCDSQAGI